jgi:phosphohistidine phosphatase
VDDRFGPLVMRVFLVRHGEASAAPDDGARTLTAAGRAQIERLAAWCAAHGVAPHEIRHSGILRAEQTAEILAAHLAPPGGVRAVRGLAPHDDPQMVADVLPHETSDVMLVTHMPFVAELASLLTGSRSSIGFATGTIACLTKDGAQFRAEESFSP